MGHELRGHTPPQSTIQNNNNTPLQFWLECVDDPFRGLRSPSDPVQTLFLLPLTGVLRGPMFLGKGSLGKAAMGMVVEKIKGVVVGMKDAETG